MYDNSVDPYQMRNLIDIDEYAALQKKLEAMLQAKLRQTGDKFHPKQHYLKEWGYKVDRSGAIQYFFQGNKPANFTVQSPMNNRKNPL
jgi:hypothetical protein